MTDTRNKPTRYQLYVVDDIHGVTVTKHLGGCKSPTQATILLNNAYAQQILIKPKQVLLVKSANVINCYPSTDGMLVSVVDKSVIDPEKPKPQLEFLFDEASRTIVNSQMLDYKLAWYVMGSVISVTPNTKPDITYLVDLEDMCCTCDTYMFKADPQLVGTQRVNRDPCRHIILVQHLIGKGLLKNIGHLEGGVD